MYKAFGWDDKKSRAEKIAAFEKLTLAEQFEGIKRFLGPRSSGPLRGIRSSYAAMMGGTGKDGVAYRKGDPGYGPQIKFDKAPKDDVITYAEGELHVIEATSNKRFAAAAKVLGEVQSEMNAGP